MRYAEINITYSDKEAEKLVEQLSATLKERVDNLTRKGGSRQTVWDDPLTKLLRNQLIETYQKNCSPKLYIKED